MTPSLQYQCLASKQEGWSFKSDPPLGPTGKRDPSPSRVLSAPVKVPFRRSRPGGCDRVHRLTVSGSPQASWSSRCRWRTARHVPTSGCLPAVPRGSTNTLRQPCRHAASACAPSGTDAAVGQPPAVVCSPRPRRPGQRGSGRRRAALSHLIAAGTARPGCRSSALRSAGGGATRSRAGAGGAAGWMTSRGPQAGS
jgi:hypothetical protein